MPAWPATLPPPLSPGWSHTAPDGVLRTPMEAGPEKRRLETTADEAEESLQFRLTAAQLTTLNTFFLVDTKRGALSFTLTHPIWGALPAVNFAGPPQFVEKKPRFLATVRVKFKV